MRIEKIIYPTDLSEESLLALPMAEAIAKANGATLIIVYAYEDDVVYTDGIAAAYAAHPVEHRQNAQNRLNELLPEDSGITVERKLLDGAPTSSLIEFAREAAVDLIVLVTHGRSGFSHLLMGSVAEKIVREAPCPVLSLSAGAGAKSLEENE